MFHKIKRVESLNNEAFFKMAQVDQGGYAIIWDDELDISGEELYVNGVDSV